MHDGSLRAGRGRKAVEIVSPVLKGADGVRQVLAVVRELNARGATVNKTCGLHVHVGFDKNNRPALERLVTLAANFEKPNTWVPALASFVPAEGLLSARASCRAGWPMRAT